MHADEEAVFQIDPNSSEHRATWKRNECHCKNWKNWQDDIQHYKLFHRITASRISATHKSTHKSWCTNIISSHAVVCYFDGEFPKWQHMGEHLSQHLADPPHSFNIRFTVCGFRKESTNEHDAVFEQEDGGILLGCELNQLNNDDQIESKWYRKEKCKSK